MDVYEFTLEDVIRGKLNFSHPEHWTFFRFTGLRDKRGTEIYEGDIVKDDDIQMLDVAFEEAKFIIRGHAGQDVDLSNACWNHNDVEVIGNIYENPDLLK